MAGIKQTQKGPNIARKVGGGGVAGEGEKAGKIKGGRAGGWEMNAAD